MPTPPVNSTPHIRLNSGQYNQFGESDDTSPPIPPKHGFQRVLTPSPSAPGPTFPESSDYLIPPKPSSNSRANLISPLSTTMSSRRTSVDSSNEPYNYGQDHPYGTGSDCHLVSPTTESRPVSRSGSEPDVTVQTVATKYNIMPMDGLLLFPEDTERDDYMHNPDPAEKERECDICNRRGMVNMGGLIVLVLGFLMLFVGYPVLTFVRGIVKPKPWEIRCREDPLCLGVGKRSLLKNIRSGLIDPDTPESAKQKKSADGKEWKLVFSDEFNRDGRTFYDGDDPYYQAVDLWYGVTHDLEWYDPDAVTTRDGVLELRFDKFKNHDLDYRSGMVQSWNKLCFTGGRLEASVSLPGNGQVSGFWPGFWTMGNLGRAGYAATTDGMWPYSYHDECDAGITPNQSTPDGLSFLPGMKLPACTCKGGSHPSPGKSRSAPELDVFEASVEPLNGDSDKVVGSVSQSLQIAPFDIWYMPDYDFTAVYDLQITGINPYAGGPFQQAMSGLSNLNNDWYAGKEYQIYAFEYTPGADGSVTWFVGENTKTWTLDGRAMGPNGNIGQRVIPMEPMAVVMNLGMASNFAPIDESISEFMPGIMRFDYIRIYQDPESESVSCDPVGYETTDYIEAHPKAYQNFNMTSWSKAGYDWPKNSFMDGC